MIKNIVFDFGGVIVDIDRDKANALAVERPIRTPVNDPGPVLTAMTKIYAERAGSMEQPQRADEAAHALRMVRRAELNRRHLQTEAYARAVSEQTTDLRRAVVLSALSPALAISVWAVAMRMA